MKLRRIGIFSAVLAVLILLIWMFVPHEQLLLTKARRTAFNIDDNTPYVWDTNHTVICLSYNPNDQRYNLTRLDVDTGKRSPLDSLNRRTASFLQVKQVNPLRSGRPSLQAYCTLSPDGKWLLFYTVNYETDMAFFQYMAVSPDGDQELHWQSDGHHGSFPLWLHDSRRWIEAEDKRVHGQPALKDVVVHETGPPESMNRIPAQIRGYLLTLGITKEDRLFGAVGPSDLFNLRSHAAPSINLEDYDFQSPTGSIHKHVLPLPMTARLSDIKISLQGDRLALLVSYDQVSPIIRLVHRIWPSYPLQSKPVVGLWVCNLDGSNMTEIGHKTALPDSPSDKEIQGLRWLPDGKQISFEYQSALYTLSAP